MKNTTKLLALLLACLMLCSVLVACGGDSGTTTVKPNNTDTSTPGGNEPDDNGYVADDVPTDLRFDDETVTLLVRNDKELWLYEMDVDTIMNDTLYDAIYYRNKTVEDRLGVTITTLGRAGTYSKRAEWNDTVRTAVNTKLDDYDGAAVYMSTGSVLAVEGIYYNVKELPNINLEKPWWNQDIKNELDLFDTLYYLAGDIAITEIAEGNCMFYNKDLFDRYFSAQNIDLYSVVENKQWTIDYLYDLAAQVHEDSNGDGVVSDGDVVGYGDSIAGNKDDGSRDAWVAAMGINLTTMEQGIPELSFYSERTISAYEKISKLLTQNPGTLALNKPEYTKFSNGNVMIMRGNLNSGSTLREMKDRYGVLPYPMYEENQDGGYRTVFTNNASVVVVLSSLADDRTELVGTTLELMAAESYRQVRPAYFEVALKSKYSEDPADAKMYDIILDSITFSFGYCYSTGSLEGVGSLFRNLTLDLAAIWEENEEIYREKLEVLIQGLDDAAFNAMYGD